MSARVLISLVTYNSARHIEPCLESLGAQTCRDFELHIFDNASTDSTAAILDSCRPRPAAVRYSDRNLGFCAAHNLVIGSGTSDYVLVLNPDVILRPRFLEIMIEAMDRDPKAGSATGKLYRWRPNPDGPAPPPAGREGMELDSTGFYFTRNQRHLDRGSGEPDTSRYDRREYVFGASGAAAFYRRGMLEDARRGTEYFDESFFAYREDADLAWRAQWLGWRCLYVPEAVGFHERRVLPRGRAKLPAAVNMHSFKNRFLLRIKNMDTGTYIRNFIPITVRDTAALAYVLLREQSSLRGIPMLLKAVPKALEDRRELKKKRRTSPREIRRWLSGLRSKPL